MFTREEMWALESKALKAADDVMNQSWKRALMRLADSACEVDAYLARSEVRVVEMTPPIPKGLKEAIETGKQTEEKLRNNNNDPAADDIKILHEFATMVMGPVVDESTLPISSAV
jgi:hypothetical protein